MTKKIIDYQKEMAKLKKDEWFRSQPKLIQEKILAYPPFEKYVLKTTNQIVHLYSYSESEDGTCEECIVVILQKENPGLSFDRRVFGIKLADLGQLN